VGWATFRPPWMVAKSIGGQWAMLCSPLAIILGLDISWVRLTAGSLDKFYIFIFF
jgi:hypothetical protein